MSVKFRTWVPDRIDKVEILRETDKCVFLYNKFRRGGVERAAKVTEFHAYHDTWEEAKAYLLDIAEAAVEKAEMRLNNRKRVLESVLALQPPADDV